MTNDDKSSREIAVAVLTGLASNPGVPGELFGVVGDVANGTERNGAEKDKYGRKPGDDGIFNISSPTSAVMFDETEKHMMEAALALKELYENLNPDFSSQLTIERSIKRLEGALTRWQRVYGDDLIMQDTGPNYVGADAVAESYLAKNFQITKPEAVGAVRAMTKRDFPEQCVYRTNDKLPMGRLLIIDCQPQVKTDPMYFFIYRIPKNLNGDGSRTKTAAYATSVKKAA